MKYLIAIILSATFLLSETGCKKAIDDAVDCTVESIFLSVKTEIDANNPKLVHFEFINNDTEGDFTLDPEIKWDFGDGETGTSNNNKIDHTYSAGGNYSVKADYTLHKGKSSCSSYKEASVNIH